MTDTRKTILHADDEAGSRDYVAAILGDRYHVVSVRDFDTALARIKQGGIDLVILDHLMPGDYPLADAAAVCEHLREKYPSLPVVVYTSSLEDAPTTREDLERMIGSPVVCKGDADPSHDPLLAKVEECLRPSR
jgi:CheY-like chemotaxis protein